MHFSIALVHKREARWALNGASDQIVLTASFEDSDILQEVKCKKIVSVAHASNYVLSYQKDSPNNNHKYILSKSSLIVKLASAWLISGFDFTVVI